MKDDIEEKEEKLQEKFERALRQQRKPKSVEQLLRKPRKSVLERVNKMKYIKISKTIDSDSRT